MTREASAAMPASVIKHSTRFVTSSPAAGAVPVAVTALAEGVIQMMWLARLRPLVAVAAALILATVGVAVQGRQQPAPDRAREQAKAAAPPKAGAGAAAVPNVAANRALAREQLALIDPALAMLERLYQNCQSVLPTRVSPCGHAVRWRRFARLEPGRPRSLRRWRVTLTG